MFNTATPEKEKFEKPQYEYTAEELQNRDASFDQALYGNLASQEVAEDFDAWEQELGDGNDQAAPGTLDRQRGINMGDVDAAMADNTKLGTNSGERRKDLAEAYDDITGSDSLEQRQFNAEVSEIATEVADTTQALGVERPDLETVKERTMAEMAQRFVDGRDPVQENSTMLDTSALNEARRAVEAAFVVDAVEEGNTEVLNRLDDSTADKVVAASQTIEEHGGVAHMSNEALAGLGRTIEQSSPATGDTVSFVDKDGNVREVQKDNRLRAIAVDLLDGNTHKAYASMKNMSPYVKDEIHYYLETAGEKYNLKDPDVRNMVITELETKMIRDSKGSEYEKPKEKAYDR